MCLGDDTTTATLCVTYLILPHDARQISWCIRIGYDVFMLHVLMARGVEGLEDFVTKCGKSTGRCFEFQQTDSGLFF